MRSEIFKEKLPGDYHRDRFVFIDVPTELFHRLYAGLHPVLLGDKCAI